MAFFVRYIYVMKRYITFGSDVTICCFRCLRKNEELNTQFRMREKNEPSTFACSKLKSNIL